MLNFNSGETKSSIEKFKRMLKTNLNFYFDAQEFEDIIVHYLGFGDNQLAKKALQMGLDQHPSCHGLLLLQSELYIIDEKYDTALKLLEYIEDLNPSDEEIALQKATIASKKGDHKDSINYLRNALSISNDPYEIWNLLGMEYLILDNYYEASNCFKKCLSDNPEDYPSLYNLLYCYDKLNMDHSAIEALNKVLEHDPYCEVAWHQLGKVYLKSGKFDDALSAFEFSIISDETFTGAYIEKGKLLELLGRLNEAILNYQFALQTTESNAFIQNSIGRCHEKLGNNSVAEEFYFKSVELEPTNENCWLSLIIFLVTQKKLKKAKLYLEKSLIINGDSIELWKNNVELCIKLEEEKEIYKSYQKLLSLGHYASDVINKIIDFFLEKKNWRKAQTIAENAFAFCPNNRDLEIRIAGCCFHLNKIDEAMYLLNLNQMDKKDKRKFFFLFPELESIVTKNIAT